MTKEKITIYCQGMFGINKHEMKLVKYGAQNYAQYDNAPFVTAMKPRARKYGNTFRATGYDPFLIVVKGWNHPDPQDAFKPAVKSETTGLMVSKGRYISCDPRWVSDFTDNVKFKPEDILIYAVGQEKIIN